MFHLSKLVTLSESQNHRCAYCGTVMLFNDDGPDAVSTDHVRPVSQGGLRVWDNEIAACKFCNNSRDTINAEAYFHMVQTHGRVKAAAQARIIRSQIARRMAPREASLPPAFAATASDKLARQEEARRRWLAAIKETERARAETLAKERNKLVARGASGAIVAVFHRQAPTVTAPHGKPKDCNFDPALRPVALIKPPAKRMEPIPLEKMSKRHRRQVKIASEAQAPMQTA